MNFLKHRGLVPLITVAIAALLWKIDLFEWVQASVDVPDLVPQMADSEHWVVASVSDGDTLRVGLDGQEKEIRLCGLDAPESAQSLGDESQAYLESLLAKNQHGLVIVVPVQEDQYGRTVAELFVQPDPNDRYQPEEEISINAEMLMAGMAYVYPQYVNSCPNGEILKRAEAIAQEAKVGVWAVDYQRPWEYRRHR